MAQARRLVSRCLPSPRQPRPRSPLANTPATRQITGTAAPASGGASKLIAALDALHMNPVVDVIGQDENLNVLRPRRGNDHPKDKGSLRSGPNTVQESPTKPVHPFFLAPTSLEAASTEARPAPKKTTGTDHPGSKPSSSTDSSYSRSSALCVKHSVARPSQSSTSTTSKARTPPSTVLPLYSFQDYIQHRPMMVFTKAEEEANDLVTGLKTGPIALDMEWRVFFTRQRNSSSSQMSERRTAVVQVADARGVILVIQVFGMERFPRNLQALIESPDIPKVGVNILNDGKKLFRDYGILAKNLVELGALALVVDPDLQIGKTRRKIISLAKLVERYCGKILQKGNERTGNWEGVLDFAQLEYAANDVHSALIVYQLLSDLAQKRGIAVDDFAPEYTSNVNFNNPKDSEDSISRTSSLTTTSTVSEGSKKIDAISGNGNYATGGPVMPAMRPQYLRAYRYWHERGMDLQKMCIELNLKGNGERLKASTVISYVIGALQADSTLPFAMWKLRELVQMDGVSWVWHREWILSTWAEGRGVLDSEQKHDSLVQEVTDK